MIGIRAGHARDTSVSAVRSPYNTHVNTASISGMPPPSVHHARGASLTGATSYVSPTMGASTISTPGGHYRRPSIAGELTAEQAEAKAAELALEKKRRTDVRSAVATALVLCADPLDFVGGLAQLLRTRKEALYQLECLAQLVFFVQKDVEYIPLLVENHRLPVLIVEAMLTNPTDQELQMRGLELMWTLICNVVWNRAPKEVSYKLAQCGAILAVVEAMRNHRTCEPLQRLGITAMRNFGLDARNLLILTEKGACERLLTGLELWTKAGEQRLGNEAIKLGLEVMVLFSAHRENQMCISRRGGFDIIREAMPHFPLHALHAYLAVTQDNPRLNREVGLQGLQAIVQTLEDTINTKSKETEAIQEAGLTTLWRLAANTDRNKKELNLETQCLKVVYLAMGAFKSRLGIQLAACGLLRSLASHPSIFRTPEMRSLLSLIMPVAVDPTFADQHLLQEHIVVTLLELCSPRSRRVTHDEPSVVASPNPAPPTPPMSPMMITSAPSSPMPAGTSLVSPGGTTSSANAAANDEKEREKASKQFREQLVAQPDHLEHFIGLLKKSSDAVILESTCRLLTELGAEGEARAHWNFQAANEVGEAVIRRMPDPDIAPAVRNDDKSPPISPLSPRTAGRSAPLWLPQSPQEKEAQRMALYTVREAAMRMMDVFTPVEYKDHVGVLTQYLKHQSDTANKQTRSTRCIIC